MQNSLQRQAIRQTIRQQRQTLTTQQQIAAQQAIAQQVQTQQLIQANDKIALYLANDGEVNPHAIIEYAWQIGAEVFLPVLHSFARGHLAFLKYHPDTQLIKNKFGIPEPQLNVQYICPPNQLTHVFMPLVAFDDKGNRMGMGGGFYDRSFALSHPSQLKIGLAHDCQQVPALPTESWDVPLNMILTPSQMIKPA